VGTFGYFSADVGVQHSFPPTNATNPSLQGMSYQSSMARSLCLCGASFVGADVPGFFYAWHPVFSAQKLLLLAFAELQDKDPEPELFRRLWECLL